METSAMTNVGSSVLNSWFLVGGLLKSFSQTLTDNGIQNNYLYMDLKSYATHDRCEEALCLFWKILGTRKLNATLWMAPTNRAWLYLFISSQRELLKSYTWHTFGSSSRNSARHHCLCDIRKCHRGTCLLDMCKSYAACRTDTSALPALT